MKFEKSKLWLCLPFLLIFLVDAGITLAGQPSAYWEGDRQCVNEAFPLFAWGLSNGPWAFALLCLVWLLVFGTLITLAPFIFSEILSLALVNGHTWGAMTWLVYYVQLDYNLCLLFFVFSASIYILSYTKMKKANQRLEPTRDNAG